MNKLKIAENLRRILSKMIDMSSDKDMSHNVGRVLLNLQAFDRIVDFTIYMNNTRKDSVIYYKCRGDSVMTRLVIKP